jgi:hypothetical protein
MPRPSAPLATSSTEAPRYFRTVGLLRGWYTETERQEAAAIALELWYTEHKAPEAEAVPRPLAPAIMTR